MAKSKLVRANEEIAEEVVGGYRKIEETVVGGYRKIEDAFVDRYLTREGESVGEARARLQAEQEQRRTREQHGSHAPQGAGYVPQAQEQTAEHAGRAKEMAHVPERQTKAN